MEQKAKCGSYKILEKVERVVLTEFQFTLTTNYFFTKRQPSVNHFHMTPPRHVSSCKVCLLISPSPNSMCLLSLLKIQKAPKAQLASCRGSKEWRERFF